MSHIVQIETQIKDEHAARAACTRLQLTAPEHKTVRLFSATATGLCVQLPGWQYPVNANLQTGQVQYDNYGGHWGEQARSLAPGHPWVELLRCWGQLLARRKSNLAASVAGLEALPISGSFPDRWPALATCRGPRNCSRGASARRPRAPIGFACI